jgi:peptidoglycan/LPS O-acetylase OafA/YrhL
MIDFTDPRVARLFKRRAIALMLVSAAGGVTWYALAPDVASTQAGSILILPGLITLLVWAGRRLPRWLDWVIAIAFALGGNVAYVLVGGSQWWFWGQLACWPLVLLVLTWVRPPRPDDKRPGVQWYGGMQDGPWGPP